MGLLDSFCLLPFLLPTGLGSPFVTTWNVSQSPYQIALPDITAQTPVTINWGDGSPNDSIAAGNALAAPTHPYSTAGLVNVSVDGQFLWKGDPSYAAKPDLIDIVSWGDGFLVDNTSSSLFAGYTNLRVSADPTHTLCFCLDPLWIACSGKLPSTLP